MFCVMYMLVGLITDNIIKNWCILNYKSGSSTTSKHIFVIWMLVYIRIGTYEHEG